MQWLTRDRGAVGIFVAISVVALLGMAGLAVDVGAMYDTEPRTPVSST